MDKYNDELKMQFSAYVKQSILNRRGQYLRKKYRIESLEVNYEEYLSVLKQDTEELFGKIEKLSGKVFSEIVESRLLLEQIEDYQLLQALITLSEEQKKVILLRIFYEKTFREIDWILGFPEKKAENTYYNAIKKLRKLMGGKRHELPGKNILYTTTRCVTYSTWDQQKRFKTLKRTGWGIRISCVASGGKYIRTLFR